MFYWNHRVVKKTYLRLIPVTVDILSPYRTDLRIKGNIGKILEFKYNGYVPLSFRCFELDLKNIKTLISKCSYFDIKNWKFKFIRNAEFLELEDRKLIREDEQGIFFQLGIVRTISGGWK